MRCTHGEAVDGVRVTRLDCLCGYRLDQARRQAMNRMVELIQNQKSMPEIATKAIREKLWELYE